MQRTKTILVVFFLSIGFHCFAQADTTYSLKVRLIKAEPKPADCGVIAWALTQKFEILESSFNNLKLKTIILLNEPCPEFLGKDFFITNKVYKVSITKESGAPFGYVLVNYYKKEILLSIGSKK